MLSGSAMRTVGDLLRVQQRPAAGRAAHRVEAAARTDSASKRPAVTSFRPRHRRPRRHSTGRPGGVTARASEKPRRSPCCARHIRRRRMRKCQRRGSSHAVRAAIPYACGFTPVKLRVTDSTLRPGPADLRGWHGNAHRLDRAFASILIPRHVARAAASSRTCSPRWYAALDEFIDAVVRRRSAFAHTRPGRSGAAEARLAQGASRREPIFGRSRHGYYGTHTARDPRNIMENRQVHGLHAVPGRDPQGRLSAAQLPTILVDLTGWRSRTRRCSTKARPRPKRWRSVSPRRAETRAIVPGGADCHPQTISGAGARRPAVSRS